jgi:hypothetical protein
MQMIEILTEDGVAVSIYENDLSSISDKQLRVLRISREELDRVFADGCALMDVWAVRPGDRVRPVASETPGGRWVVRLVRYSSENDPLPNDPPAGKA